MKHSPPISSTEIYFSLCNIMDPGFYPTDPPGAEATKGGCHIRLLDNLGLAQIFFFAHFHISFSRLLAKNCGLAQICLFYTFYISIAENFLFCTFCISVAQIFPFRRFSHFSHLLAKKQRQTQMFYAFQKVLLLVICHWQ